MMDIFYYGFELQMSESSRQDKDLCVEESIVFLVNAIVPTL